jgi:hypothetical protein
LCRPARRDLCRLENFPRGTPLFQVCLGNFFSAFAHLGGLLFELDLNDLIQRQIYFLGAYEPIESLVG